MSSAALKKPDFGFDAVALKERLDRDGAVVIAADEGFFTPAEWESLEKASVHSDLPYEEVQIGDAGEPNLVEVGRLMTDVERPKVVNDAVSRAMLGILGAPDKMELYATIIDAEQVYLRRAQINKMHAGSFIGTHVDQDSNPDYSIAIVLQMGSAFEGGDFVVHKPGDERFRVHPHYRSVIISRCDFAHEVEKIESGVRKSLVYFVAAHAGDNRRVTAIPAGASPALMRQS
jgi:hypothetical protein